MSTFNPRCPKVWRSINFVNNRFENFKVKLLLLIFLVSFKSFTQENNISISICTLPSINAIKKPVNNNVIEKSKVQFVDFNNRGLLINYKLKENFSLTSGLLYESNTNYYVFKDSSYNWHYGYIHKSFYSSNILYIPLWLNFHYYSGEKIQVSTSFGLNKAGLFIANFKYIYYSSWRTNFLSNFEESEFRQGILYDEFDINLLIKLNYSINKRFGVFLIPLLGYNNINEEISIYRFKFNLGFGISIK